MNKNKQIRVLHVLGGKMDLGGIEIFLMNYFRSIDKEKVTFDFLITEEGAGYFDDEILQLGGRIYSVVSKRKNLFKHIIQVENIFRKYKQNPLHFHLDGMNGLYSILALLVGNKVRVSHSHNTEHLTDNFLKIFVHNFFRLSNRITSNYFAASSNAAHRWLHGGIIKDYKWIPNAIYTNKFVFDSDKRKKINDKYGLENYFVLGHVGRFHPQKNHSFMLALAVELKKRSSTDFKIVFVGDGDLRHEIEKKIDFNEINDQLLLLGKVENVSELYNAYDLFIFPSNYEGLGIAVVEAQYNGLTCLVSKGIPKEAFISDTIFQLELNISDWVDSIIELINVKKNHRTSKIKNNNFEIKQSAIMLENYYGELK